MSLARCIELLEDLEPVRIQGRVRELIGLIIEAEGLALPVGAACEIRTVPAVSVSASNACSGWPSSNST